MPGMSPSAVPAFSDCVSLLHQLPLAAAARSPDRVAVTCGEDHLTYAALAQSVDQCATGLRALDLMPGSRVAVYLDKRMETVVTSFAATAAGCVLVPVNPVLKPAQVAHILKDAEAQVLVTTPQRSRTLFEALTTCEALRHLVLCGDRGPKLGDEPAGAWLPLEWSELLQSCNSQWTPPMVETDVAAIFYTSGSTGLPKGVVLSHRNLVAGARSVAGYLGNQCSDTLLAALPLSFDAGFSQLTTAFSVGARVVLVNPLLPQDVLTTMAREQVTGITAVPPLYTQLAGLAWPDGASEHLRYWANTGGRLPRVTLERLRALAPRARPYLMYGLTEAFRSTYLPPEEVDRRPDSIGRAIPNADVRVLRDDGTECGIDEPGELVHRGPLVALGYWRREAETAQRFRPWPMALSPARAGVAQPEFAVFSGDTVRRDAEGFLYFVGRRDDMIKTSGYRVSPTEVEEVVFASGLVSEALAVGRTHESLGQDIVVVAVPSDLAGSDATTNTVALLAHCRKSLPSYMVPSAVHWAAEALPRNPNGKLDRLQWRQKIEQL